VRVALVLPGQGSQRPGMGATWRDTPGWALVEQASALLGRDLQSLLLDADAEVLRATREAQVATYLTSLLALDALGTLPRLEVVAVAGHSLGELTALVAADVLDRQAAMLLVAERGDAMQAAADAAPGTMAAVLGLEPAEVARVCAEVGGVWPANDNAPRHVVVSGTPAGVAAVTPRLTQAGARRVLPLPVGGAFHTPLMAPARERLDAALRTTAYGAPRVPVLANVTAAPYDGDVAGLLSRQLTEPVRWRELLLALPPVDAVVEVGPGGVLTGLVSRTLPGVRALSVARPSDLEVLQ